ncbi:Pkinase-domain-containing protein, partial [Fomitiporia mediterranea MF3/22]|uniref:Pkinase-domain-containing protein n=1 Tax=Fomitiporia mediterranea (strain MF3/22) TaxID=694068 RepID=UPI0004407C66
MIGPWKIGRTIGKGAMGVVRIARHAKTGQYAAVKIMSKMQVIQSRRSLKNLEDDAERILRALEREIVVMKLVDHPNIMRLYDVWETSGELYLILEYVEGGELFDYIIERGRLSEAEALDYFQQLINAMDYCHRLNIAHRDLKPENILLDKDKILKVADFGMAAWQCGDSLLKTSCGSPHYASPEVISSQPYDGAISDVWSCGVILYALLAGKLPFDDEDVCALLQKVSCGKFDMPTDIDPLAQDMLKRMLEKDVNKRIKISEIVKHPWFTSKPQRVSHYDAPSLDEISRPITKASEIDVDIFGNLRTLWHGAPDEDIVEGLINEKRSWEKVVYTLL